MFEPIQPPLFHLYPWGMEQALHHVKKIAAFYIFQGVLMYKLDHFYAMSQLENTHVRQSYVSLFTTVLKNAVRLKCKQSSLEEDEVSDLITTRKEPLKPLILPDTIPEDAFDLRASVSHI